MRALDELFLPEQLLLLALNDERGTMQGQSFELGAAGAVLAELLLAGRIVLDQATKKHPVNVADRSSLADPILDEVLARIRTAKRPSPLATWVQRIAGTRRLRHRIADRLRYRGILGKREGRLLLVFSRQLYPTMNPAPERELVARLRQAVLTEEAVEPRTAIMIALARQLDLLRYVLSKTELKARKKRLQQLGELASADPAVREAVAAVKQVIDAMHAAVVVAAAG